MVGASAYDIRASTGLRLKPGEGLESVSGFCQGLNGLDEFSDIATQMMNRKYPQLGPFRVSCWPDNEGLNELNDILIKTQPNYTKKLND